MPTSTASQHLRSRLVLSLAASVLPVVANAQSVEVIGDVTRFIGSPTAPSPNPSPSWVTFAEDALYISYSADKSGTVNVIGGGLFKVGNLNMAKEKNTGSAAAVVNVSGAGSRVEIAFANNVGLKGTATLNITAGATVTDPYGNIASGTGSEGTANVSGAGSTWTTKDLGVGVWGTGRLNVTSGGRVVNTTNSFIGFQATSVGEALVSGVGSRFETQKSLYIGGTWAIPTAGQGKLTIESGGTVTVGESTRVYAGDRIDILNTGTLRTQSLVTSGDVNVFGTVTATNGVNVQSGGVIGGGGEIQGDLALQTGAKLQFLPGSTLSVTGNVILPSSFGVDDLLGLSVSTPVGTYVLIDTTEASFGLLAIQNWGIENAYQLGGGKSAFFREGSLILEVIPEPASYAIFMQVAVAGFCLVSRRRRRA